MNRRLIGSACVTMALLAGLLASEPLAAQGGVGPTIDWSVGDGVAGVDLPLVVTGTAIDENGLKRLDVVVGLELEYRKLTATGGQFAIVIFGEPKGPLARFTLEVRATDFSDNVTVRTAEIIGRRPSIAVDPIEPLELDYPLEIGGTANAGFRHGELSVTGLVDGRPVDVRVERAGAEYGGVQEFNYEIDPRFLKGWVWAPGDEVELRFVMVDVANRRAERVVNVPLPEVEHYCGGYGVTTNLALGDSPTQGSDIILGTPGPDLIFGLDGPDVICALGGNDVIYAGYGNDVVNAGRGDDVVYGGAGRDILDGRLGNDRLFGGEGNDTLLGGSGADTLLGQFGTDSADGGRNRDECEAESQASCEVVTPAA